VENGSYLVRAANTGVSAVIAPTGAILVQTPLFVEAAIVGTIRLRRGETPYARYGDVLALGCTVFLAAYGVALLWSFAARRRAQQGGTDDSGSRTGA
jgi:apolipoprotein N-acyltransferase